VRPLAPRLAGVAGLLLALALPTSASAETRVEKGPVGMTVQVDGAPFFIRGMNWDHYPVGTNYRYSLWAQDDATVLRVLEREMPLMAAMGVNAIRLYDDVPPRWVSVIYERWGIRTMVNPLFGRYGLTIDGLWVPQVDYANPVHRAAIREQTLASVERFKGTPGVLLYVLGNENNYGLSWTSFEAEDLPQGEQDKARAKPLYTLFGEVIDAIHAVDPAHPVAICNGDLQYLDLVAAHAPNLDLFGTNVYRGRQAGDLYQRVRDTLGVPVFYTEFGADAWDAKRNREDSLTQARYLVAQWADLYANAAGQGAGNAVGGFVFQWSDGWWKTRQDERLDVHDIHASWPNGGYAEDFVEGRNNMNEEWFGITAKLPPNAAGDTVLLPRPAVDALTQVWRLDPYGLDPAVRQASFAAIEPALALPTYELALQAQNPVLQLVDAGLLLSTTTAQDSRRDPAPTFGHTEAARLVFGLRPSPAFSADVGLHMLGGVAGNSLDPLTWETRGGTLMPEDPAPGAPPPAQLTVEGADRLRIETIQAHWETNTFELRAFHRVGHGHWADQGDVFGLYREAWYGPNIDTYAAEVPSGVEVVGAGPLRAFALAMGPQLWWGANPGLVAKAQARTGPLTWTAVHQQDIAAQPDDLANRAIPQPIGRASALNLGAQAGRLHLDLAGLQAGSEHVGEAFVSVADAAPGDSYGDSGYHVLLDEVHPADTLGGRMKLVYEGARVRAYALATHRGRVADAGPDPAITITAWTLKDHGVGNVNALFAGAAVSAGVLSIAPNLMVQRPLDGPVPALNPTWEADTGWYFAGTRPRNIVDDPFSVSANRETVAGELLLTYDPSPGTWWWAWDHAQTEDAPFGASLDLVYRHQPTARDAALGFDAEGNLFTFGEGLPAADTWDATLKGILTPGGLRLLAGAFVGSAQSTGDDARLVLRKGGDLSLWWGVTALQVGARWDDWGPYDYHRTFNLTFPFQAWGDLSTGLTGLRLPTPGTRLGLRGKYREFDGHSPDALLLGEAGQQFEIVTYLEVRK